MPSTGFVDGSTVIETDWLNEVNVTINMTLPAFLASISDAKNVRLPNIESPGWVTNTCVSNVNWSKVTSRPTTMVGYGIVDRPTLLNIRVFTTAQSGSMYAPTTGTSRIYVEMVGGGGSGGRAISPGTPQHTSTAPGGSAGTWASGMFTAGLTGNVITVGAGGACLSGGSMAGGTTSLGTLLSCPGGAGGADGVDQYYSYSTPFSGPSPHPTAFTPDATGTYLMSFRGAPGGTPNPDFRGGGGASSKYGKGGEWNAARVNPPETSAPIQNYGSGGAGASNSAGWGDVTLGGSGAPGIIVIWEYNS